VVVIAFDHSDATLLRVANNRASAPVFWAHAQPDAANKLKLATMSGCTGAFVLMGLASGLPWGKIVTLTCQREPLP
jgi:hypothetical protein